ncbi:diacylglycerol kinase family lipid kinase [Arthrobacter agilis]|uniref:diacylglycerol/lipid kinase family protein n=1 Tax=Arthrobacter agilis TaxID=37921 RepID=UPI000B361E06|nr:diacylglycerol kinase family protein [Arthrobacter agilis]OUM43141.1 diacylglycerol kinase [Arthrobacter agilis]PPB46085.1 diacylglycerol kinase [Arthrobacter agilis]TPV25627.1 diacylglycerol kinase family lipid kinase [Arthrobacter agilis]VDR33399.1 Diacylglycerol kinase [Arthrobacter agilis]
MPTDAPSGATTPVPASDAGAQAGAGGRRAALIINPIKATTADVEGAVRRISTEDGWDEPLIIETTQDDPGHGQAREALDAGVDLVIAAGGDGTVRCVAEELSGSGTMMALVPLGTGNLLARNLDIAVDDPDAAVEAAFRGTERTIDVVHLIVDHAQDAHVFLVMAGIGYDAAIMSDTREDLKDKVGWLAYVDAGIRNLPGKPARTTISIDGGQPFERRLRSVMGGNCGKIMGGLEIFPGARIDDGLMDLMTIAPKGKLGWLAVVGKLFARGKGKDPSLEYFQCRTAEVTLREPLDVQLDGDPLGKATHMSFEVRPDSLRLRMPLGFKDPAVVSDPLP